MPNRGSSIRSIQEAWPRLLSLYRQQVNSDGIYLLLKPKQQEHFNHSWTSSSSAASSSTRSPPPQAAVLVILCCVDHEPSILFTRRSSTMTSHASEISFPGGHYDPVLDNDSLLNTALREAVEELRPVHNEKEKGWFESEVDIYGQTTPIPSLKGTPVTPYLAMWPRTTANGNLQPPVNDIFPGDPSEVDLVFHVPLQELLANETTHELPENRFGLVKAPLFPTKHGDIWGLTAYILRPLLHRLWRPAFFY